MAHFSKFIRPGAVRIGFELSDEELMVTAAQNQDGSIVLIVLNMGMDVKELNISLKEGNTQLQISAQAIRTIVIPG